MAGNKGNDRHRQAEIIQDRQFQLSDDQPPRRNQLLTLHQARPYALPIWLVLMDKYANTKPGRRTLDRLVSMAIR